MFGMSACSAKGGDMWQTQPTISQHHHTVAFNSCNLLTVWLRTHDWRSITPAAQTRVEKRGSASRLCWSHKWLWETLSEPKEKRPPQFRWPVWWAGRPFLWHKDALWVEEVAFVLISSHHLWYKAIVPWHQHLSGHTHQHSKFRPAAHILLCL